MTTALYPRGGLGNQMFQIAAAYAHAKENANALHIRRQKDSDEKRPRYWSNMFVQCAPFLCDTLEETVPEWHQPHNGVTTYRPIPEGSWRLCGLFQCSQYFAKYKDDIRSLFTPPPEIQTMVKYKYADLLAQQNVVVVHARRGDYLGLSHVMTVLPEFYYRIAMKKIKEDMGDAVPHFLFVCEEPDFWKGVVDPSDSYTVLEEPDEVLTMALISQFKHFIIANSTFSWWAAWLSGSAHVYAPAHWFGPYGPKEFRELYEPGWIVIS